MTVIVYHSYYGCETGCCGHRIELKDDNGEAIKHNFTFSHFGADEKEYIKRLVADEFGEDHIKDIDFDNCIFDDGNNC